MLTKFEKGNFSGVEAQKSKFYREKCPLGKEHLGLLV